MRQGEFLMVCTLNCGRKPAHADARVRLTQISRGSLEAFIFANIGTGSRVMVLQHGVRREMGGNRTEWAEGCDSSHELDGLQFATEFELQHIVDRNIIRGGEGQGLKLSIVNAKIRRRQT